MIVTDFHDAFNYAQYFNADLSQWIVSKATRMDSMFNTARVFDRDLSKWNTSKVTRMEQMFKVALKFNHDIGNWVRKLLYLVLLFAQQIFLVWVPFFF